MSPGEWIEKYDAPCIFRLALPLSGQLGAKVPLVMLPLAWQISLAPAAISVEPRPWRDRFASAGAIVGGLACMATSIAMEQFATAAYLVNATHEELTIDIYRVAEPLDCATVRLDPQAALLGEQFEFDRCTTAEPFALVPLDQDWRELTDMPQHQNDYDGPGRDCDAVVMRIAGMADTVLFWISGPKAEIHTEAYRVNMTDAVDDPTSVIIERLGNELLIGPGSAFKAWSVDWPLRPGSGSCREAP